MRSRSGFTIFELLVVLTIAGIVGTFAIPAFSKSIAGNRVQRAASVMAGDLQLAHSMAARRRAPVRISIDTATKVMRVRDFVTPATLYSQRWYNEDSEFPVMSMSGDTGRVVFPSGLLSAPLTVTLRAGGETRQVVMSRVGQIRVTAP